MTILDWLRVIIAGLLLAGGLLALLAYYIETTIGEDEDDHY